jgi:hypothetical protein
MTIPINGFTRENPNHPINNYLKINLAFNRAEVKNGSGQTLLTTPFTGPKPFDPSAKEPIRTIATSIPDSLDSNGRPYISQNLLNIQQGRENIKLKSGLILPGETLDLYKVPFPSPLVEEMTLEKGNVSAHATFTGTIVEPSKTKTLKYGIMAYSAKTTDQSYGCLRMVNINGLSKLLHTPKKEAIGVKDPKNPLAQALHESDGSIAEIIYDLTEYTSTPNPKGAGKLITLELAPHNKDIVTLVNGKNNDYTDVKVAQVTLASIVAELKRDNKDAKIKMLPNFEQLPAKENDTKIIYVNEQVVNEMLKQSKVLNQNIDTQAKMIIKAPIAISF